MHIERDLIQTKLSPDLNDYAYNNRLEGVKFQDLRWGIDTEEGDEIDKDKKILEVCLDEIENNRPYFCVLLGDRYGWIPDNDLVKTTGYRYGIYGEDEEIEKSITHLEIDYGFLRNLEYSDHSFVYIRNIIGDVEGSIYESSEVERAKMEALKAEIKKVLPADHIREYDVEYRNGALIGVEKFIDLAREDIIRSVMDSHQDQDELSETQKEISYHRTQADEKAVISNARRSIEEDIVKNIENTNVIIIKGESGNGKSTMMAKLSKKISGNHKSIILFSSLTPRTTSASGVMKLITDYINEVLISKESEFAVDLDSKLEEYNIEQEDIARENDRITGRSREEKLYEAALREYFSKSDEELIILIDAIDQLDNPQGIDILLKPLHFISNSRVKFIISYLDTVKTEDQFLFLNSYTSYRLLELNKEDKLEVIDASLKANNKELATEVKNDIIAKEGSKSPLYIALLVQRLVMMNSEDYNRIIKAGDGYHILTNYQKNLIEQMPNDLEELIIELIRQAAINLNTNVEDVFQIVGYISLSTRGLRESDLRLIFAQDGKNYNSLDFASLKKYLRAFFLEDKYLRTDFTHKIIRRAVLDTIDDDIRIRLHNNIANAMMQLPITDPIKLQEQYFSAYKSKNVASALELMKNMGENADKISNYEIESSVESITKNHNVKLDKSDDEWMARLFEGFSEMKLSTQKTLLTYYVYNSYEEKTDESIKAANYNQELLLNYIRGLIDDYQNDEQLMQLYSDHTTYLGVKYASGNQEQRRKAEIIFTEATEINVILSRIYPKKANREKLANSYSNLGRFYLDSGGDYLHKALDLYLLALEILEEIASEDSSMVSEENLAMAYNNVALVYSRGEYNDARKAKEYFKKSIEIFDKLLEESNSISLKKTIAMSYVNIASLYFSGDNFAKAEIWYTKAIDMVREIEALEPTLDNKETLARVYNNIADLYASDVINNKVAAEKHYFMAIDIFEKILDHKPIVSAKMSLSISYDNLANLYSDRKNEQAHMYYKKAIGLKEELINMNSPNSDYIVLATSYNNLAFFYVDNGINLTEALDNYHKALKILHWIEPKEMDKRYGEDLAVVYTNLGVLYFMLGDVKNSEDHYRRAIAIHKTLIEEFEDDDNIEKLIIIYNNLATNKLDMEYSLEEVEDEYVKVVKLIKIIRDPFKKLKKTAITYGNLGTLYLLKDKNYELAEDCYLKSVALFTELAENHATIENLERVAVIYHNLTQLYELWGKVELRDRYAEIVNQMSEDIDYERNKDTINKFIHIHEIDKIYSMS